MNKLCFYLLTLICGLAFSQDGYNFQTVLSDGNGQTINNTELRFRVSFLYDSPDSNEVAFSEEHQTSTNEFGLVNIIVGQGELPTGDLNIVDYSRTIFIKEEYDLGSGFTVKGFSKMMEVPVSSYTRNVSPEAFQKGANFGVGAQSFSLNNSQEKLSLEQFEAIEFEMPGPFTPNSLEFDFNYADDDSDERPTLNQIETNSDIRDLSSNTTNKSNRAKSNSFSNAFNTGFGQSVFARLTTGMFNTSFGAFSLRNVEEGFSNIAFGNGALQKNINGSGNIALGPFAMQEWGYVESTDELDWSSNIAIGNSAMAESLDSKNNISIGFSNQLRTNTSNNISLGNYSLFHNRDGVYGEDFSGHNIALGHSALYGKAERDGFKNIGIGWEALYSNVSNQSIAIGSEAMKEAGKDTSYGRNISNFQNIAIGQGSLKWITGHQNIAIGTLSGSGENNSGFGNISLGYNTLLNNTTGWYNVSIGLAALSKNTEGFRNSAIGSNALKNNLTGDYNTALGNSALSNNISGSYNTAVGHLSGRGAIGLTSGNYNTFLGVIAGASNEDLVNSTAIGYDAVVKQSNAIQLGNEDIELVETSGTVSATAFRGDGSQLTNLPQNSGLISRTDNIITIGDDQVTEVNTSGVVSASGFKGIGNDILINTGDGEYKNLATMYTELYTNPWVEFFNSDFTSEHQYGSNPVYNSKIYISTLANNNANSIFRSGGGGIVRVNEYMFNDSYLVIRFYPSPSGLKVSFGQRTTNNGGSNDPSGIINVENYASRFGDQFRPANLFLVDQDNNAYRIDVEVVTETRLDTPPNTITGVSHFAILPTDTKWFKILAIGDQELNQIVNGKFIAPETSTDINERVINGSTIQFANSVGYPQASNSSSGSGYVLSPSIIYYQEAKSFVVNVQGVKTYFE